MPVYEYRCENGHLFEVMQRMSDGPPAACVECGAPVQKVFHPVAVHFKGSGFYNTDYGRKKGGGSSSEDGAGSSSDSGDVKKKDSGEKSSKSSDKSGSSSGKSDSGSKSDSGKSGSGSSSSND